jgi:hypothetical protein
VETQPEALRRLDTGFRVAIALPKRRR